MNFQIVDSQGKFGRNRQILHEKDDYPVHAFLPLAPQGGLAARRARNGWLEHILIDSTIVRAHQHSGGALKKAARKRSDVPEVG